MSTKISEFTLTGSAPTGAMIPIAYDSANYRVPASKVTASSGYTSGFSNSFPGSIDSGGSPTSAVDDGMDLLVTHSLNSVDLLVQVYVADDADGTNMHQLNNQSDGTVSALYDYQVRGLTTNTLTVRLAPTGFTTTSRGSTTATHTSYSGKYIKVVIIAI